LLASCAVFASLLFTREGLGWRSGWYLLPDLALEVLAPLFAMIAGFAVNAWLRPRPPRSH